MKDVFLLDLDDTLLDFRRAERENLRITLGAYRISFTEERYARFHAINDALWKQLERGEMTRERLKELRFSRLFEEFGVRADVPAVAATYFSNFEEICFPYEGAREFVRALSLRGRAYLVTNGSSRIQRRHVAAAGLSPYFADMFISEELGCDKPSIEYARRAEERIVGFRRERAVWIGDSPTSDMVCANAAGIDFWQFDRDGDPAAQYADMLARLEDQ